MLVRIATSASRRASEAVPTVSIECHTAPVDGSDGSEAAALERGAPYADEVAIVASALAVGGGVVLQRLESRTRKCSLLAGRDSRYSGTRPGRDGFDVLLNCSSTALRLLGARGTSDDASERGYVHCRSVPAADGAGAGIGNAAVGNGFERGERRFALTFPGPGINGHREFGSIL